MINIITYLTPLTFVPPFHYPGTVRARSKVWLATKGSPQSKIDRLEVRAEGDLAALTFEAFDVDRTKADRF